MAVNSPNSPRQKMINVMYLVFIAMLALNVPIEVLNGFGVVDKQLGNSSRLMDERNRLIMDQLEAYKKSNPEKAESWYNKGVQVHQMSDSLIQYVDELKQK